MGFQARAILVIFDMNDFDIILDMTFLSPCYDVLNCNTNFVTLEISGKEKLKWEMVMSLSKLRLYHSFGLKN